MPTASQSMASRATGHTLQCFQVKGYGGHRKNVASPLPTGGGVLPCFTFPDASLSAGSYLNLGGPWLSQGLQ